MPIRRLKNTQVSSEVFGKVFVKEFVTFTTDVKSLKGLYNAHSKTKEHLTIQRSTDKKPLTDHVD